MTVAPWLSLDENDRRGGRFLLGVSRENQVHRVLTFAFLRTAWLKKTGS